MSTAAIVAIVAVVACGDPAPPPADPLCSACGVGAPPPPASDLKSVVLDNRTDHPVTVTVPDLLPISIDRRVVDGSIAVPIGPAKRGADQRVSLAPHATTIFTTSVQVLNGESVETTTGGAFRVGDGPLSFAVGRGFLAVRNTGAGDFLEADDPKLLTVLAVESDTPACAANVFGSAPIDKLAPLFAGETTPVASITRDDAGCRVFHFDASAKLTEYRVCVPDAAFPFLDGDSLTIEPTSLDGARITNTTGTSLELLDVRFEARKTVRVSQLDFAFSEEPACADVAAVCGDVGVPAKARLSFDGMTAQSLVVGGSAVDPNDPGRTVFLAGAVARPVFATSCGERVGATYPGELVIAIVDKP